MYVYVCFCFFSPVIIHNVLISSDSCRQCYPKQEAEETILEKLKEMFLCDLGSILKQPPHEEDQELFFLQLGGQADKHMSLLTEAANLCQQAANIPSQG